MTTIGDVAKKMYKNYFAPSKEEIKQDKKEIDLTTPKTDDLKTEWTTKALTPEKLFNAATQCPFFIKGARKKSMDSVRAWFNITPLQEKGKVFAEDLKLIQDFELRSQIQYKWSLARVSSFIYGDGYLIISFKGDTTTNTLEPPTEGSYPWNVRLIDSECIDKIGYPNDSYKKGIIKYFHYISKDPSEEDKWIHPDRILHIPNDEVAGKMFGTSTVNLLRNVIKSKINVDIACGEILAWFAHGIYDVTQENCKAKDRKAWEDLINRHPSAIVHDETGKVISINPQAIDPKPFYDYLITNIAAAFRMPKHILEGIEVGRVTGAEVGYGDYYKDVKDDQDLIYTPRLLFLYKKILEGQGRTWRYAIEWNPVYIDELAEADIYLKHAQIADLAKNGSKMGGGYITDSEAREIFNKGAIALDPSISPPLKPNPDITPKNPEPDSPINPPTHPNENTKKIVQEVKGGLDIQEKTMITKLKEQIEKERKLGEEILSEQEKI
jgi:hypothetical protein